MRALSRSNWLMALYAALAVLAVPVFAHFVSPNELSRWLLAASLVEDRTPEVSRYSPLLGEGFEDLSVVGGRTYSNKAPGAALAALPGYLLARPFAGPPGPGSIRPALYAMRLFGATIPLLLLAFAVDRVARRLGADDEGRARALFALLFATPLFAYGLLLFAHVLVAACLFGAWAALFPAAPDGERKAGTSGDVAGGALIGLAVLSDYTAAVPGLVLFAVAAGHGGIRRSLRVALGGLPFALVLVAYNLACFGEVFAASYRYEKFTPYRDIASRGVFGVTLPSPRMLFRLFLDPVRGLLVFVPLLVLVPRAMGRLKGRMPSGAFSALVLVPVSILLVFSGYPNFGGWNVGPRYVLGAIPFLILPVAFVPSGWIAAALLGASAAAVVMTTFPFPFIPDGFPFPWASFAFPLLVEHAAMPNLASLVSDRLAFYLPFALVVAAAAIAVPRRRALPLVLGAAFWFCAAFLHPAASKPSVLSKVQVAYVEDVYLDRPGALDRLLASFPPGLGLPERLIARRERERKLPPPPWGR